MNYFCRVIQQQDLNAIIQFEQKRMEQLIPDETERMFAHWNSRARQEAMEHHIPMGWSFLALNENQEIVGYFLAQPLLFFDGQTQSLWVEHVQYANEQARNELCELAYRLSREKHFQRVYFQQTDEINQAVSAFKPENWNAKTLMLKTTKAM